MARQTRRSLLALGGLLVAGTPALAEPEDEETANSSALAKARLKLSQDALKLAHTAIGRGQSAPGERDPVYIWSRRRMEARLDLSTKKADRIAAVQEHLDLMKEIEQLVNRLHQAGQGDPLAKLDAHYRRLEAETALEREMKS